MTLACGSVTRPSIMALTLLRTVLSKATLGARLTTHCALNSKRLGKLDGLPARDGPKEKGEKKEKGRELVGTGLQEGWIKQNLEHTDSVHLKNVRNFKMIYLLSKPTSQDTFTNGRMVTLRNTQMKKIKLHHMIRKNRGICKSSQVFFLVNCMDSKSTILLSIHYVNDNIWPKWNLQMLYHMFWRKYIISYNEAQEEMETLCT